MKHQRDKTSFMHLANKNCVRYCEMYITRKDGKIR